MTKASANYVRMSPRKLRRVVNEIRGKSANQAQVVLKFMPYAAARVVEKVLKSAVANAKENESLDPSTLRVTMAFVDQANTLRRWRPMSRGRGYSILKRVSHVTIEVNPADNIKPSKGKASKVKTTNAVHKHEHGPNCNHDHEHDHGQHEQEEKATKTKKVKEVETLHETSNKTDKKTKKKKDKE
mgnify:CR=1 FL=1